jgi:hypothetical protein
MFGAFGTNWLIRLHGPLIAGAMLMGLAGCSSEPGELVVSEGDSDLSAAVKKPSAQPVITEELKFTPPKGPEIISDGLNTLKVKILRIPDGTLFAVYGEEMEVNINSNGLVWDAKKGTTRRPFDIMIKYSLDNGETWSGPRNISNTAHLSSAKGIIVQGSLLYLDPASGYPDLNTDPNAVDYPGDSEKPNVFNVGNRLLVTWIDKYCNPQEQRYVSYPELDGVTIPYSCTYAARLDWDSLNQDWGSVFKVDRLSSGIRDAKQDSNRGNPNGWVVTWQEDPLGLKLGDAEGCGDGASGAVVSSGTDIWYSYLPAANFPTGSWAASTRITRNASASVILTGEAMALHPEGLYDRGKVGSSRPNLGQVGSQVVIAYEETKGVPEASKGRLVRYHHFTYNAPPVGGEVGILISDPRENARRVRFLTQSLTEEVPLLFIYRQGTDTQGGPSDIMMRRAVGGVSADKLDPPIDVVNSRNSVVLGISPLELNYDLHQPAINFSGTQAPGEHTGSAPLAATDANAEEDAVAHRGVMRGSSILMGYSYVSEKYAFIDDQEPYKFYVRRSTDAGRTWSDAVDLSSKVTAETGYSVREPRLVGTPSSGPNCEVDPRDCQNPDVIYAGYGLQKMTDEADVDIYMMYSKDNGATWSEAKAITAGDVLGLGWEDDVEDFETQIRVRPDGQETFTVWSGYDGEVANVMFRRGEIISKATPDISVEKKPKK